MLKTYLIIALRTMRRAPVASALNIGGLALGIAVAFVLGLYVRNELSYDRHIPGGDRIYRVATDFFHFGGFAKSQEQLLDVLPQEVPAVEAWTRLDAGGASELPIAVGDRVFRASRYLYADTAFFSLFPHPFASGAGDLNAPDAIVLSERLARAYFGDEPALGRVVLVDTERTAHRVTGVVADDRGRSHLAADLWLPLVREVEPPAGWTNVHYYNYVRLRPGASRQALEEGLARIRRSHAFPSAGASGGFEAWAESDYAVHFTVQPLRDIYLQSALRFEIGPGGNPTQVAVLGLIGLFTLVIAAFNYVNLTTARASARMKEVGVKKALGAAPATLRRQFLVESLVFSTAAFLVAVVLAQALLHVFASITGTPLIDGLFTDLRYVGALAAFSLAVGVAAGAYPAFILARVRPSGMLPAAGAAVGGSRLRSTLVVAQFAIAIGLGIGSMVVYRQLAFMQDVDKGFADEGVLVVQNAGMLGDRIEAFRRQVAQLPAVVETSLARRVPTGTAVAMYSYQTPTMPDPMTLQTFRADDAFLPALGLRLLEGRNLSRERASDTLAAIVNQAAVRALGLGDDPIGKDIGEGRLVVGVVADFHFQSLRQAIEPAVVTYTDTGNQLLVRLSSEGAGTFAGELAGLWETFGADEPLRYAFLDDNFARMVANERMLSQAVTFFTVLALAIACLGLFGLTAFSVARRTKEIGIRKVLGASVPGLVRVLASDFVRLVVVGFVIAAPLAYVVAARWLEGYAYRVTLGPGLFLAGGGLALAVALLTVSVQALRAALADPVQSLRYE